MPKIIITKPSKCQWMAILKTERLKIFFVGHMSLLSEIDTYFNNRI